MLEELSLSIGKCKMYEKEHLIKDILNELGLYRDYKGYKRTTTVLAMMRELSEEEQASPLVYIVKK